MRTSRRSRRPCSLAKRAAIAPPAIGPPGWVVSRSFARSARPTIPCPVGIDPAIVGEVRGAMAGQIRYDHPMVYGQAGDDRIQCAAFAMGPCSSTTAGPRRPPALQWKFQPGAGAAVVTGLSAKAVDGPARRGRPHFSRLFVLCFLVHLSPAMMSSFCAAISTQRGYEKE